MAESTIGESTQAAFGGDERPLFAWLTWEVALYGLSPDSQPKPRQMARTVDLAKKLKAKVIFFEIFVSDELARVLAREVGAEIRILNPGVNLTTAQIKEGVTFLQLMEDNLENLKYGLSCPGDR